MRAAGLDVHRVAYAHLLEDWSTARTVLRIDDAASLAVAERGLTDAEVETFFAEQERRSDTGVFAASMLSIQALGAKP